MQVKNWSDISNEFRDTLVLGNGASIAIDQRFDYRSLLEKGRELGLITPQVQKIFNYLKAEDFEEVLLILGFVRNINKNLEIKEETTTNAYGEIREALIKTILKIHPEHGVVKPYFPAMREFLRHFRRIISLCYDLTLYWSIGDDIKHFADGFGNGGLFVGNWPDGWMQRNSYTSIFYPHGNLFLVTDSDGKPKKIKRDAGSDLRTEITKAWNHCTPLFVCEGDWSQKLKAIRNSNYLLKVYDEWIPRAKETLAIYGWSLNNDDHIIKQLCESKGLKKIAVSVHQHTLPKPFDGYRDEIEQKIKGLNPNIQEILFYDSESPACWIYSHHPSTTGSCSFL
jgi:hypothetical protein